MDYDAVVFDADGVLIEPTDFALIRSAIGTVFADFGVPDPPDEHIDALLGATVDGLQSVCSAHGLDPRQFWYHRDRTVSRVQRAAIRDGRKPLYEDVAALPDIPAERAIVSNNQRDTIDFVVDHFGLADQFAAQYGREPVIEGLRRKKPNPYYLRRALSDLGTDNALYVGDSASDVAAAHRMGIDAAFVRRPHAVDVTLDRSPRYEVRNLTELVSTISQDGSTTDGSAPI